MSRACFPGFVSGSSAHWIRTCVHVVSHTRPFKTWVQCRHQLLDWRFSQWAFSIWDKAIMLKRERANIFRCQWNRRVGTAEKKWWQRLFDLTSITGNSFWRMQKFLGFTLSKFFHPNFYEHNFGKVSFPLCKSKSARLERFLYTNIFLNFSRGLIYSEKKGKKKGLVLVVVHPLLLNCLWLKWS